VRPCGMLQVFHIFFLKVSSSLYGDIDTYLLATFPSVCISVCHSWTGRLNTTTKSDSFTCFMLPLLRFSLRGAVWPCRGMLNVFGITTISDVFVRAVNTPGPLLFLVLLLFIKPRPLFDSE
jgi:hypothetical protein